MAAPRRVELNLGWACNNGCVFCGEQERRETSREEGMFLVPSERVRAQLERFRREGFDHVTFLGGEPTIRKDFLDIVRHARRLGFRHVFLTTNGRRMSDRRYLRALLRAGLTDVCLSVHGPDAECHDALTARPGSFAQLEQALLNLVLERQPFHTSTVVVTPNAPRLEELVRYLQRYRPTRIYLALPNPSGGAYRDFAALYPTYAETAPHVHAALRAARALRQPVSVSKLPPCHLQGFEAHSDDLAWAAGGLPETPAEGGGGLRRRITPQVVEAIEQRWGDRTAHALACGRCRYRWVCEGVEVAYLQRRGGAELVPVPGEPVRSAAELRRLGAARGDGGEETR